MALKLRADGEYEVTTGRYAGRTLSWVIANGTPGGMDRLEEFCWNDGQWDIYETERKRQRIFMSWCFKCEVSTLHDHRGCTDCRYRDNPVPSLEELLGPEWSVANVVARMEAK